MTLQIRSNLLQKDLEGQETGLNSESVGAERIHEGRIIRQGQRFYIKEYSLNIDGSDRQECHKTCIKKKSSDLKGAAGGKNKQAKKQTKLNRKIWFIMPLFHNSNTKELDTGLLVIYQIFMKRQTTEWQCLHISTGSAQQTAAKPGPLYSYLKERQY